MFLMLDTPNPRNPGSSLLSCSLIVSMAPVPQTPLRVFLCDKHYFSLIIFRIVSVVPAKVSVVIESFRSCFRSDTRSFRSKFMVFLSIFDDASFIQDINSIKGP